MYSSVGIIEQADSGRELVQVFSFRSNGFPIITLTTKTTIKDVCCLYMHGYRVRSQGLDTTFFSNHVKGL